MKHTFSFVMSLAIVMCTLTFTGCDDKAGKIKECFNQYDACMKKADDARQKALDDAEKCRQAARDKLKQALADCLKNHPKGGPAADDCITAAGRAYDADIAACDAAFKNAWDAANAMAEACLTDLKKCLG